MRIGVFGIGAMGCLFGARLHPYATVTLIGHWQEQIQNLNSRGLRLIRADGEDEQIPLRATSDSSSVGEVDLALILVKAAGTAHAAQDAARILAPSGLALTLQNGLGNFDVLAQHIGQEHVALGVTAQGATVLELGVLRHAGEGATHLATRREIAAQVEEVAALFVRAGFETHVTENLDSLMWGKLAINAGINALTALLRVPNGALLESEWTRTLMAEAACEAARVAEAQSIELPFTDPTTQVEAVARMTATNRSSMLQDVLRGGPTEIETINGAIVREGERLGVPTPVNRMLYYLVKAGEVTRPFRVD